MIFEENNVLDDLHLEIIDMHCQYTFDAEYKREELKIKSNSIDENDRNVIDYGHLKKICNNIMSHGKENVTSFPSEKFLRK